MPVLTSSSSPSSAPPHAAQALPDAAPAAHPFAALGAAEGATTGGVRWLLRLEGAAVLALALWAYHQQAAGWGLFAAAFLAPDLSFLGYLAGPRVGARLYNAAHSYLGPAACLALGLLAAVPWAVPAALIWAAHIGFDRALGYGLKYPSGFRHTHLGLIGRPPR
ncbi:DUF4260 domain-containing protein [Caldimonas aquatica]|uniref:DUF4260 domain-containing protein n=1 Tax=Caldimonas aquatica TaxID=376175 RepID=A0ABY6MSU6_9BURK|nr:DUF4260 domain-containing protein [Schlegelella aquatica]UZD55056.1 DUF4260 domain-containing protein [Schlegelella aquatica]